MPGTAWSLARASATTASLAASRVECPPACFRRAAPTPRPLCVAVLPPIAPPSTADIPPTTNAQPPSNHTPPPILPAEKLWQAGGMGTGQGPCLVGAAAAQAGRPSGRGWQPLATGCRGQAHPQVTGSPSTSDGGPVISPAADCLSSSDGRPAVAVRRRLLDGQGTPTCPQVVSGPGTRRSSLPLLPLDCGAQPKPAAVVALVLTPGLSMHVWAQRPPPPVCAPRTRQCRWLHANARQICYVKEKKNGWKQASPARASGRGAGAPSHSLSSLSHPNRRESWH